MESWRVLIILAVIVAGAVPAAGQAPVQAEIDPLEAWAAESWGSEAGPIISADTPQYCNYRVNLPFKRTYRFSSGQRLRAAPPTAPAQPPGSAPPGGTQTTDSPAATPTHARTDAERVALVREMVRRTQAANHANHLKRIGLALHEYYQQSTPSSENHTTKPENPPTQPENPSVPMVGFTIKATQAALTGGPATAFAGGLVKLGLPDPQIPVAGAPKDTQTAHSADPLQGTTGPDGTWTAPWLSQWRPSLLRSAERARDAAAASQPTYTLSLDLTPKTSTIVYYADDDAVARNDFDNLLDWGDDPRIPTSVLGNRFYRGLAVDRVQSFNFGGRTVETLSYPAAQGAEVAKALQALTDRSPNITTEPNLCLEKKPGPADPFLRSRGTWKQAHEDQWAIKRVGMVEGPDSPWTLAGVSAKPVVVAVIDTGLDWDHLDFARENLWTNAREVPGNGVDDDKNGYVDDVIGWDFVEGDNRPWDRDGHGTFVSGVIAAAHNDVGIAGVNPHARIMVLRALNDFGHTRASYVAEAIVYAADNGARVINLSVGGKGRTKTLQMAIDYARAKGALVVVAAGNEAEDVSGQQPAGLDGVLAVGASGLDDRRAPFSNWGPRIDLAAPGLDVLSLRARATDLMRDIPGVEYTPGAAYVGADRRYYRASGTSFSAPIVAGVASLVWSLRPELTAEDVRRILLHSARDVDSPGRDQFTGYGLLDARAALKADPRYFVEAEITGVRVAQAGGGTVVEVSGTAEADRFRAARLELGAGKSPQAWKPVGAPLPRPLRAGVLTAIPAAALAGAKEWTIRLLVEHENGSQRETRFLLTLG